LTKKPPVEGAGQGAEAIADGAGKKLLNPGTLKTLGKAVGKLGLVAAGITIAATSLTLMSEYLNKNAIEAEKAAASAERLSKNYETVREAE